MSRCVIIAGSPYISNLEFKDDDYVIACDSGFYHAKNLKIDVNMVIGDFDSYKFDFDFVETPNPFDNISKSISMTGKFNYRGKETILVCANSVKDETDTLLAIKCAFEIGYTSFVIYGATGGRLDHYHANITCLAYITSRGGYCEIIDNQNTILGLYNGKITLKNKKDSYFSCFSYSDVAVGVTITGAKYNIDNYDLNNLFPIGVSNNFLDDEVTINVKKGLLIVCISSDL